MSGLVRGARPALAVAVTDLTALAAVSSASAGSAAEPPAPVLERELRGEQAIRELGDRSRPSRPRTTSAPRSSAPRFATTRC